MAANYAVETTWRARARKHGSAQAFISGPEGLFVKDEKSLFAEKLNFGERIWFVERFLKPGKLKADLDTFTSSVADTELIKYTKANQDWSVIGTNMTSALSTIDTGGGNLLTTAGASADSGILYPSLSTGQSAWSTVLWPTSKEVHFHTIVVGRSATFSSHTFWAGLKLTNTPVIATDDDQVFFRYQDTVNSGTWGFQSSIGGTDATLVNSGVTVAVDVPNLLSIIIDENRCASAYVDGVLIATTGALTSTNLIPYIGVLAGAGAAKKLTCRGVIMSRKAA